jgi:hypothetical protein
VAVDRGFLFGTADRGVVMIPFDRVHVAAAVVKGGMV